MKLALPARIHVRRAVAELERVLDVREGAGAEAVFRAVGLTTFDLFALRTALLHEVPSSPGDEVRIKRGRRLAGVQRVPKQGPRPAGKPSHRGSAVALGKLVEGIRKRAPDVYPYTVAALILMLLDVDTGRVLFGTMRTKPPKGRERVRWLALRIRDLTRPSRKESPATR